MAAKKTTGRTTGAIKNPNQGGAGKKAIASGGGGRAALLRWRELRKTDPEAAKEAKAGGAAAIREAVGMPAGGRKNPPARSKPKAATSNKPRPSGSTATRTTSGRSNRGNRSNAGRSSSGNARNPAGVNARKPAARPATPRTGSNLNSAGGMTPAQRTAAAARAATPRYDPLSSANAGTPRRPMSDIEKARAAGKKPAIDEIANAARGLFGPGTMLGEALAVPGSKRLSSRKK